MPENKLKVGTIRQRVIFKASPIEVYEVLMNSKKHTAMTGAKAVCSPKVGGKIIAWDGYITGKNLRLTKGKMILQEWRTTEFPEGYGPSILKFTFKKKGDTTELVMVQTNVPKEQLNDYVDGWKNFYWVKMKKYLSKVKSK